MYSNFAGKEDLFLTLFEETIDADIRDYSRLAREGGDRRQQTRAAADRWMEILRVRPAYFPLFVELWAHALREPELRRRLGDRFAAFRQALARVIREGAEERGVELPQELAERAGTVIGALGNGLALEKLVNPEAVPDELFGDAFVLMLDALEALAQRSGA